MKFQKLLVIAAYAIGREHFIGQLAYDVESRGSGNALFGQRPVQATGKAGVEHPH